MILSVMLRVFTIGSSLNKWVSETHTVVAMVDQCSSYDEILSKFQKLT